MKKISLFLLSSLLFIAACKKDKVDATTPLSFQESINDLSSSLNTIQQIKFNEALYILKTFGVEEEGNTKELNALGKLINGLKTPEILALADKTAKENNIDWSSTAPPSLGSLNIFGDTTANEHDYNDIKANGLTFDVIPNAESLQTASSLRVKPTLLDAQNNAISFSGAALEGTIEVLSNGSRLYSAKNLVQDNNFQGFNVRLSNLSAEKVVDNKIDIRVTISTSHKKHVFTKMGIEVNPNALKQPTVIAVDSTQQTTSTEEIPVGNNAEAQKPNQDPRSTVNKFLSNLNSQNLKAAYDTSDNANWGSYDNFSNPTSGFGSVKSITVKSVNSKNVTQNSSSVDVSYDVTDKNGNTTSTKATFGLKNVNGEWKISSYKVN